MKAFLNQNFRLRDCQRGFSLVEVTMAIGIAAFAILSVVGLMPVGMDVFSKTVKTSSSKRIADRLMAEIRDTPWDTLKDYAGGSASTGWGFYETKFDINGDATSGSDWVFKANVSVSSTQGETWRYPVKLPGNPGYDEQNLRHITVTVAYWPEHPAGGENDKSGRWIFSPTSDVSQRGDVRTYQFLLGKNGL